MLFIFLNLKNGSRINRGPPPPPTTKLWILRALPPLPSPRLHQHSPPLHSGLLGGLPASSGKTHQLINGKHQQDTSQTPLSAAPTRRGPCGLGAPSLRMERSPFNHISHSQWIRRDSGPPPHPCGSEQRTVNVGTARVSLWSQLGSRDAASPLRPDLTNSKTVVSEAVPGGRPQEPLAGG